MVDRMNVVIKARTEQQHTETNAVRQQIATHRDNLAYLHIETTIIVALTNANPHRSVVIVAIHGHM